MLRRAVADDGLRLDADLAEDRHGGDVAAAADLFEADGRVQPGPASAAVLLGDAQPQDAQLAEQFHVRPGELAAALPFLGARLELALGYLAHQTPHGLLLFGQAEVQAAS